MRWPAGPAMGPAAQEPQSAGLVRKKTLHEGWYGGPSRPTLALDVGGQGSAQRFRVLFLCAVIRLGVGVK